MSTEIVEVLNERGKRYGEFPEHARITQNIKDAMADSPNWKDLPAFQKEALHMLAHKIGRVLNGDPTYDDNFVDILGYGQLALTEMRRVNSVQSIAALPKKRK